MQVTQHDILNDEHAHRLLHFIKITMRSDTSGKLWHHIEMLGFTVQHDLVDSIIMVTLDIEWKVMAG